MPKIPVLSIQSWVLYYKILGDGRSILPVSKDGCIVSTMTKVNNRCHSFLEDNGPIMDQYCTLPGSAAREGQHSRQTQSAELLREYKLGQS